MKKAEIAEKVKNYLTEQYEKIKELDALPNTGGKIRDLSGNITETLVEMIWEALAEEYPELKAEVVVGDERPYRIVDMDGNYIDESVDRHCYINDKLVLAIECKSYLDKCYMQRADGDFNLMKSYNNDFDGIIVSIENSIADNSYNFFMNRKNIDHVYYLADGKRNSAKMKKICYHQDRIQDDLILSLINNMDNYFLKAIAA